MRRCAREQMKLSEGYGPFAFGALDMNSCVERGKGNAHVGGVGGDAGGCFRTITGARPEDRVDAVEAFESGASAAGITLVAFGVGGVVEVEAASALHQIATRGGHI